MLIGGEFAGINHTKRSETTSSSGWTFFNVSDDDERDTLVKIKNYGVNLSAGHIIQVPCKADIGVIKK